MLRQVQVFSYLHSQLFEILFFVLDNTVVNSRGTSDSKKMFALVTLCQVFVYRQFRKHGDFLD